MISNLQITQYMQIQLIDIKRSEKNVSVD